MTTMWVSGVTQRLLQHNCQPVGFHAGRLVYNSLNRRKVWDVYRDGKSITSPGGYGLVMTHRGASDLLGDVMLVEVAATAIPGAAPGEGAGNDIVLFNLADPAKSYPLVTGRQGTIWARLHPSGKRLVWSQMTKAPLVDGDPINEPFGFWEIHTAVITDTGIGGEVTYTAAQMGGNGFREAYGWNQFGDVLLASDVGVTPPAAPRWLGTQIWAMSEAPGPIVVRLTPPVNDQSGYHEFCTPAPAGMFDDAGSWLLFGWANGELGLELWRMLADGTQAKRLTYFDPSVFGDMSIGGWAFDPADPKRMLIGVQSYSGSSAIDCYELVMP